MVDSALTNGGLARQSVHEWLGLGPLPALRNSPHRWSPPLAVLVHLARQTVLVSRRTNAPLSICWIGRRVWPSVHTLRGPADAVQGDDLLPRSLFVDAPDPASRLWAIDLAARCAGVLVIADGSRLDMAATRRVQLAAEAGGWMVHLARPPQESVSLSAAATRWRLEREASPVDQPRFGIELLRSKGLRSGNIQGRKFVLQRSSRACLVPVLSPPCSRSGPAKIAG